MGGTTPGSARKSQAAGTSRALCFLDALQIMSYNLSCWYMFTQQPSTTTKVCWVCLDTHRSVVACMLTDNSDHVQVVGFRRYLTQGMHVCAAAANACCRCLQRSIAFTKHFANFTRVLRDAQRKQLLDKQAQEAAGEQQQHATTQPPADHPQAEALPLASSAPASQGSSADHALDAAVAAAVAPDVAALHVAESQGAVSAAAPTGGSRMEQTISVLDQLLGEQLAEQAAAAGPHSK